MNCSNRKWPVVINLLPWMVWILCCSAYSQTETPGGHASVQRPATPPASQAAALELGSAAGGMLALVATPVMQRHGSFADFTRGDNELRGLVKQLPVTTDAADGALLALRQGYENPNSIAGAEKILEGTNALRTSLSASVYPALMNAFRIGFAVGFTGETLIVVARFNPSDEMLVKYAPLMRRYRSTLVDDLARADLPQDFIDAVGRCDQDARSVKQLQAVINACLTVKDLVEKRPHGRTVTVTKRDDSAQPVHMHPKGFTFEYPVGWTLEDDTTNKTTLLLPPGVTLNSPGPKAMFLVDATPLQSDPFAMRAYFERQLAPARIVNFTQEPLKSDVGPGAVLSWEAEIPPADTRSGFRSFVVIMRKNWAVHIDAFGPVATTAVHDETVRRIVASFLWE